MILQRLSALVGGNVEIFLKIKYKKTAVNILRRFQQVYIAKKIQKILHLCRIFVSFVSLSLAQRAYDLQSLFAWIEWLVAILFVLVENLFPPYQDLCMQL